MIRDSDKAFMEYNSNKDKFEVTDYSDKYSGAAAEMNVDPDGRPWIADTTSGDPQYFNGNSFEFRPSNKSLNILWIAFGGDGSVYMTESSGGQGLMPYLNCGSVSKPCGQLSWWAMR